MYLIQDLVHDMAIFPRKKQINRGIKTTVSSVPAPIGGLNDRDSIAAMPKTDAVILDNWFPSTTNIEVRGGYVLQNSNPTGYVETLMAYNGAISKNLFSADSNGNIRDVTTSLTGAVASVSGLSNGRFQHINMSTPGGSFLLAVNGADKLCGFNGTNWWRDGDGTHDITGVDSATLIHCNLFKSRVWFTQKNSTKLWYLGLNSIAGTATAFDVGSLLKLGGYIMASITWTIDNAAGTQEFISFVSSEGEVLVYQGYDPSYASTFSLAGHFRIGRPQGRRFYAKMGSDIVMITADGVIMISKALLSDRSAIQEAISNKIVNSVTSDVQAYPNNFGWQIILYPIGNKLIINVPQIERLSTYQYVMNTITNAWCTFGKVNQNSAWKSYCYEVFNDQIYFGSDNAVYQCDIGSTDNGSNIISTVKPAFSYFGSHAVQKFFNMIKVYFLANTSVSANLGINVDFQDLQPQSVVKVVVGGGASQWNIAPWDTSLWGQNAFISSQWQSVTGLGVAATITARLSTNTPVSMQSVDYSFQKGGLL